MASVALIGAGYIANIHADNLKKTGVYLHTVCAPAASAFTLQRKFGFRHATPDYTTIKDVDFVLIATPSFTHYDIIKFFLQKNINVFCEKPLVVNADEAKSLLIAAKSSSANIYVNFQLRYRKEFKKIKQILTANVLGRFRCAWVIKGKESQTKKWYRDAGSLQELSIHYLDLFQWILEKEFTNIRASNIDNLGYCDTSFVVADFNNEQYVNITTSFNYPEISEEIVIIGTEKYLTYYNGFLSVRSISSPRSVTIFFLKLLMSALAPLKYFNRKEHIESLQYFLDNFYNHKLKAVSLDSLKLIEKISSAEKKSLLKHKTARE